MSNFYFFTSLNMNTYNISDIKLYDENHKIIKDKILEHYEESEYFYNKKYKIIYFMLTPKKYSKAYYINIYYKNNTKTYISSEIKISKGNNVLGHIKFNQKYNTIDQMNFTNEELLYKNNIFR